MSATAPHAIPRSVAEILLVTLNARYSHASLGLRYLLANMQELRPLTALQEFTLQRPCEEILKDIGAWVATQAQDSRPIIGFGVYIWNTRQTEPILQAIRQQHPQVIIVLGGPEVSHEVDQQSITRLADHVITGWGEVSFLQLCRDLRADKMAPKVIAGVHAPLSEIRLPYDEFSAHDLSRRVLYLEASRGCPFKCEFCLSALDKTAWPFDSSRLMSALESLYTRGARNFKFVDRTFNLKADKAREILDFFLEKLEEFPSEPLLVHFELIPDHLPDSLKHAISRFPSGVLQFEIGIQSFTPAVQTLISRRQDPRRSEENLRWLRQSSRAHLHTDLIFGLPGETLESFAASFDQLYRLDPHEIQLGILKRLRGAPVARHTQTEGLVFDPEPPYSILETRLINRETLHRFTRFARYWDLVANSGRFKRSLKWIMNSHASPFMAFSLFSDWLWSKTGKTHELTPECLLDSLYEYLQPQTNLDREGLIEALLADYLESGAHANPRCLQGRLPRWHPKDKDPSTGIRQHRHQFPG